MQKLYHRHFKTLLQTATNCIIKGKKYFTLSCPNALEWPEGFPKGVRVWDKTITNYANKQLPVIKRRLNCRAVLQWLYENGKSEYSPAMLLKEIQAVEMRVVGLLNIRDLHLIEGVRERNENKGVTDA